MVRQGGAGGGREGAVGGAAAAFSPSSPTALARRHPPAALERTAAARARRALQHAASALHCDYVLRYSMTTMTVFFPLLYGTMYSTCTDKSDWRRVFQNPDETTL